ncbi:MAG: glycosyltransferase family 2 protein [Parcubacteria group bacterium]|jgi:hypothetical protein
MINRLVSIIIVNYNGKKYLKSCIDSILKNNYDNWEVVIVDNGSKDGSLEMINDEWGNISNLHLVKLNENKGPAYARNAGAKASRGEIISFLDNDTEVEQGWITKAMKYFKSDLSVGILQCKLLMLEDKKQYDYAGEYLSSLGFLIHRAHYREEDRGQYDNPVEILAAKSAGMFIRRDVFEKIGGFDEDYFIFVEETDLGWRSWLAGYRAIFAYDSIVFHHFSVTKKIVDPKFNNHLVRFHGTKNYILTLYKNLSFKNLIIILLKNIFLWMGLAGYLILRGNFSSSGNILKGIGWNIVNFPRNYRKRKKIQKNRIISDKKLFEKIYRKRSVLSYVRQFLGAQKQLATPENQ